MGRKISATIARETANGVKTLLIHQITKQKAIVCKQCDRDKRHLGREKAAANRTNNKVRAIVKANRPFTHRQKRPELRQTLDVDFELDTGSADSFIGQASWSSIRSPPLLPVTTEYRDTESSQSTKLWKPSQVATVQPICKTLCDEFPVLFRD
ncbi:hypothetical protein CAPTEDRAFT_211753 [Capitella teleta]|uniref:Uncharacterized protein n=1 Tax=Capitella teleta TaxID=283909 RepID=R7T9R7_CAPTE|nr:hypothetical protein CAPTEDRAFT_211753 [Capitella teleta]|eukprot:ELT87734.1 hypothetical protein CAPTEDRAFT_211753 [Capitella teleta]